MRVINWLIFDFLINTGVWFFGFLVTMVIFSIKIYRRNWSGNVSLAVGWSILTFVALIAACVIFVIASNVIVNNWRRGPSRVDVSPIAAISEEYFGNIDTAILRLVNQDYLRELFFVEPAGMHSHRYATGWVPQTRFFSDMAGLSISITHYNNEDRAISDFARVGRNNNPYVLIQNENNMDIFSIYPWMSVSAGGWHVPSNLRQLRTEIRIGNVIIVLNEQQPWHSIRNDFSSQFIAVFVATLQEISS